MGLLKGDLDWIVIKAVEKDRSRRYETAAAFAADIHRYLACEPIAARPPSQVYRFRKLVRRNKVAFAAAAAVLLALVTGTAVSVWHAVRANAALEELRASAPAFVEQARALTEKERFDEAIEKLDYALKLRPSSAEYHITKARLFECQLRLREAAQSYRAALKFAPHDAAARGSAELCERLLTANADPQKLSRGSLGELLAAMQKEQRPAAQLLPIARRLGEEKQLLLAHWNTRLRELPLSAERPLEQRLTARDDGLLALDLSGTQVADLRPLEGMPLGELDCTGCARITDLAPLRGMPLRRLRLKGSGIYQIAPVADLHALEELVISQTKVVSLDPLRGLPLKVLRVAQLEISDLSVLRGLRLEELEISGTNVTHLDPLEGMPLRRLEADHVPASVLAPLSLMPLEFLSLRFTKKLDLKSLKPMPLKELYLGGAEIARFHLECPTLEVFVLPANFRPEREPNPEHVAAVRAHPRLRQIGLDADAGAERDPLQPAAEFWQEWEQKATVIQHFRDIDKDIKVAVTVLPDRTWEVKVEETKGASHGPVHSLAFLKSAPVTRLWIPQLRVSDLSDLAGMPLRLLAVRETDRRGFAPAHRDAAGGARSREDSRHRSFSVARQPAAAPLRRRNRHRRSFAAGRDATGGSLAREHESGRSVGAPGHAAAHAPLEP